MNLFFMLSVSIFDEVNGSAKKTAPQINAKPSFCKF